MVTLSGSLVSIMTATIQRSVKTAIFINCSRGPLALSLPICSSKLLESWASEESRLVHQSL